MKFEYTPTGTIEAIAWLRSIGDIQNITECNGSVNNNNAVAYANIIWERMNKTTSIPLTYKDMYGEDEPEQGEDNKGFNKPIGQ